MASLEYRGALLAEQYDLTYKDYFDTLKSADMTDTEVDAAIAGGMTGYAKVAYVTGDTTRGDASLATKAYIDAQDNLRLKLAQRGAANGAVPLDGSGRVPSSMITSTTTQKYFCGPMTPAAYHTTAQDVTTEQTIYSSAVRDPGYPYKLVVFGHLDCYSNNGNEYAKILVRYGDPVSGQIIAQGIGAQESPGADVGTVIPSIGDRFDTPTSVGLGNLWAATSFTGSGTASYHRVEGGEAKWTVPGFEASDQEWRYRRIPPSGVLPQNSDAITKTDYQKVGLTIGSTEFGYDVFFGPTRLRVCARMNEASTDWVGFELTYNTFTMKYSVGGTINTIPSGSGGWTTTGSSFGTTPSTGTSYDILCGTVNNIRQFYFYRNNVLIGQAQDNGANSKLGNSYRGWGWHARAAGAYGTTQLWPASVADVLVTDAPPSSHRISIISANPQTATTRTGGGNIYVRAVRSGSASTQRITTYKPHLTIFCVPV